MAKTVIMPKYEMAQETGTVSRWLKAEGDKIEKGEPILEVETDKVNMEVEAPASGILVGITAESGDVVPIGQVIAYILKPGEKLAEEKPAKTEPATSTNETAAAAETRHPVKTTPVAERVAESFSVDLQAVAPAQAGARITRADVESHLAQPIDQHPEAAKPAQKVRAVPAARRLARELDIDLVGVAGTGPNGRIQSHDVRRAAEAEAAVAPAAAPTAAPGERTVHRYIPLTNMRRIIAERLTASARDIPQFTVSIDINVERALEMVDDLRSSSAQVRVTLTAFLVKACAWALKRHPTVNASFGPEVITEWADINIGLAVSVAQGLLVPVVRYADQISLLEIAAQIGDLGQRARDGKLQPQELQGGTFTISNLGMFGVDQFTAIINPPEAAILAVSRAAKVPVAVGDDRIEIKRLASFTLTADHRVIDGAAAGRFLVDLKLAIERPGVLL